MSSSNNSEPRISLRTALAEQAIGYVTAALGVVAGLAWNEAVSTLINHLFPKSDGIAAKFVYAVLITLIIVPLTLLIRRLIRK